MDNYFIPHPEPFLFFVSHRSDNLADEEFGTSFLCKKKLTVRSVWHSNMERVTWKTNVAYMKYHYFV